MSADVHTQAHPAPQRRVLPPPLAFFVLFGGPLAWFVQLNACFPLATNPCFIDNQRAMPNVAGAGTSLSIIVIAALAWLVALAALLTALRAYRLSKHESAGGDHDLLEVGAGRTRFLALWGICFAAGSAVVIIVTALAFFVLPRCAG